MLYVIRKNLSEWIRPYHDLPHLAQALERQYKVQSIIELPPHTQSSKVESVYLFIIC